ncbi:MAG: hypothetical protein JWM11_253 [Planctomycetaceae bacterium]|nr:hypothetical protein [Planctomycetaceae bacterium]
MLIPAIKRLTLNRARYILFATTNECFSMPISALKRLILNRARYNV